MPPSLRPGPGPPGGGGLSAPYRRPPQVAPYHLRLDWMMWFAALSPSRADPWLPALTRKLLQAEPDVLRLLRHDPFTGRPPGAIRARLYRYRFTTREERRETGAWWVRTKVGDVLRPHRLDRAGSVEPAG